MAVVPVLIIEPGVRSILNFVGMAMLIMGVWYVDRTWDEKGSAAYHKQIESMKEKNKDQEFASSDELKVEIPKEDLDAAFPFPWAFILGWILCGVSHLFDKNEINITGPAIVGLIFSLALGIIASVPMGDAVRNRKAKKKKMLGLMFLLSWIFLAIFTSLDGDFALRNGGLPLFFCLFGAFTIIASMKFLWKYRKMGTSWEEDAKPNPEPVVYNMGGPMFIFGFIFFWIGMAQKNHPNGEALFHADCSVVDCGLPIFFNVRTALCWIAGCGMVPVVMLMDCAHDNGNEFIGFGTDGSSFGRFFETPALFLFHWTLFGVAGFFDQENRMSLAGHARTWVVFVMCVLQGIVAGILIQGALYRRNMAGKKKFSKPFLIIFVALAIDLGFSPDYGSLNAGGLAMAFGVIGMICVVAGQITVFKNRIRGDYWMTTGEVNPCPIVYSVGEPLFMFGWILVSLAMSYHYVVN